MESSGNSEVDWLGLLWRCTSGKSLCIVVVLMSCHQPGHERMIHIALHPNLRPTNYS